MSLQIHRAERADRLVDALGELLADPLDDPFATEIVVRADPGGRALAGAAAVRPARRAARAARRGLRRREFPSPRRLVAAGAPPSEPTHGAERRSVAAATRAVWPLLRRDRRRPGRALGRRALVLSRRRRDATRAPARRAAGGPRPGTWPSCSRATPSTRPGDDRRLARWPRRRRGRSPLPPDRAWQAELWRRLRDRARTRPSPAERMAAARGGAPRATRRPPTCRAGCRCSAPPGWTPTTSQCSPRWPSTATSTSGCRTPRRPCGPRSPADRAAGAPRPRGRRPHRRRWSSTGCWPTSAATPASCSCALRRRPPRSAVDHHHPAGRPRPRRRPCCSPAAGRHRRRPADLAPRPSGRCWHPADRSVQLHACHGPDRQVEVLREVLVGLLADDPTLEPRDIVVMCPDIETFAPLIAAAFGLDTAGDRGRAPGPPAAGPAGRPVAAAAQPAAGRGQPAGRRWPSPGWRRRRCSTCAPTPRWPASSASPPTTWSGCATWCSRPGVRWGLDAAHRAPVRDGRLRPEHLGRRAGPAAARRHHGRDRAALPRHRAAAGRRRLRRRRPGRPARRVVARVRLLTDALPAPRTVSGLGRPVQQAHRPADRGPARGQLAARPRLRRAGPARRAAGDDPRHRADAELALAEVSALLADAFRGRASRANFRTGTLTMCTMLPMRSVPHRVVCLLGVDDGVFPRGRRLDGDDIADARGVGRRPRPAQRGPAAAARRRAGGRGPLVVIYAGADPRTGADDPPAVPIGELLDALDLTARTADGRAGPRPRHRPAPAAAVRPGQLRPPVELGPTSRLQLRPRPRCAVPGPPARAAAAPRRPFAGTALPALAADRSVELADLTRFFGHPVRALLRERAGLSLWREDDEPDEQIPVDLDGLRPLGGRRPAAPAAPAGRRRSSSCRPRSGAAAAAAPALGQRALDRLVADVAELAPRPPGRS